MPSDFNQANALVRVANQTLPGIIPLPSAFVDHEFMSETLGNERGRIERESISNASQEPEAIEGSFTTEGEIPCEFNPEQHYHYMGNVQRRIVTTNPASGVYVHRMSVLEADPFPDFLAVQVWRDDDMGQQFRDGRVTELGISLEVDGILKITPGLQFARGDYWGEPEEIEDGATPNDAIPQLRGLHTFAHWDDATTADGDLYLIAMGAPAGGVVSVKAKLGAAATYGATAFNLTHGLDASGNPIWTRVVNSNGGLGFGTESLPVQVALVDETGIETNDEWKVPRSRAVWVPVYADAPVYSSIQAFVYVDGVEHCIESFEMTVGRPVIAQKCFGSPFARRTLIRGQREVRITLGQQYTTTKFRKKLERAQSLYFRLLASSEEEFETGYAHELEIFSPNCKLSGKPFTVESADEAVETLTLSAHLAATPVAGFSADVTMTLTNSIPDLTA